MRDDPIQATYDDAVQSEEEYRERFAPTRVLKLRFARNPRHVHVDVFSGIQDRLAHCGHLVFEHEDWEALRADLLAGHVRRGLVGGGLLRVDGDHVDDLAIELGHALLAGSKFSLVFEETPE